MARHSAFAPTSFAIFVHFAISLPMKRPNCSGVPPTGSRPPPTSFSRTAGIAITLLNASFSRFTTSGGMPAGPTRPCHAVAS